MPISRSVQDQWYAVAKSEDAPVGKVLHASLLGDDLAVWRGKSGLYAWRDYCPHRGTRLSLGHVDDGARLICPYHGWAFDESGRCIKMPAHPDQLPSARASATTYRAIDEHGLIWVSIGDPAPGAPAFFGVDDEYRRVVAGPYDVETSAPRTVENFLDMAHFPFVHTGTLGSPVFTEIKDYVVELTDDGVIARDCFVFQPQANAHSEGGLDVEYSYRIVAPLTAVLTKEPGAKEQKAQDIIMLSVQPVSEERCRAWVVLAATYGKDQPDSYFRDFQDAIFNQDLVVLESQRPKKLPLDPRMEVHQRADKTSAAYRGWLRTLGYFYGTIPDAENA